ncbi:hypothetical protein GCM10029964_079090 [Kibdelosporangium lantanae]
MQTFLPYPDFQATAEVLDARRLGKQRVEAIQVLRALTVPGYGWRHHPAAAMWAGYEEALVRYGLVVCSVWCATGRRDTCGATLRQDLRLTTGLETVRTQRDLSRAGELRRGSATPTSTAATSRRSSGRIPATTGRVSRTCRWTCRTCGRPRTAPVGPLQLDGRDVGDVGVGHSA